MLAKRGWLLLFLSIAAFYLWGLGSLPLVGPDEPRYAEVAREIEARRTCVYLLSDDEKASLDAARCTGIASDSEVAALWKRHGTTRQRRMASHAHRL